MTSRRLVTESTIKLADRICTPLHCLSSEAFTAKALMKMARENNAECTMIGGMIDNSIAYSLSNLIFFDCRR